MSGRPSAGVQRPGRRRASALRPGRGEAGRCGRGRVGRAVAVAADALHTGGDEGVALAGLDGVGGHADGLQARRAVAVDGDAGCLQPGQEARDPGDVEALLARGRAAAHHQVVDLVLGQLRHLVQQRGDHLRGEVVGPHVGQRALEGPADRAAGGGDDDGLGHAGLQGASECPETPAPCWSGAGWVRHSHPEVGDGDVELGQQPPEQRQREPLHVGRVALDTVDERR